MKGERCCSPVWSSVSFLSLIWEGGVILWEQCSMRCWWQVELVLGNIIMVIKGLQYCWTSNIIYIVMRAHNAVLARKGKEQLAATAELVDALREANLNSSWKIGSTRFNKNRTGCMRPDSKISNLMTEQDLDQLFGKSKQKSKLKTEATCHERRELTPLRRDFTTIQFLRVDDEFDRMLTGLPPSFCQKENIAWLAEQIDLTLKFKKDYVVGKVIGEGAYASVRVAIYKPQSRKIAIKAYEKVKIKDQQRKKTVRREIKILQMVNHPNIVKIMDVVETNNHVNIMMEYLPGISLGSSIKQQPGHRFPEEYCRKVLRELAEAMKYLHNRSIAHRDIKLENIILDDKNSPKLIDFGFSTCIERGKKVKIFCGTPSYMAPQIVQKKEYRGENADIWALGVLLFVMLTGCFPFKGSTDEELYQQINTADYPKKEISAFRKAAQLIAQMFVIDPQERITAEGILNHPWLSETALSPRVDTQQRRVENLDLRRFLNLSKEKSPSMRHVDNSKSKAKHYDDREKCFGKTAKNLTGKLASGLNRPRLERTVNPLKEEILQAYKMERRQLQGKVEDALKLQGRRRSEEKNKCRSHRA